MVAKRAVPKEQNTSRVDAGMQPVGEAFLSALEQCAEGAEPEAVHRVRTGSRRLQAMIESTTPSEAFGKLTRARLRQLKKIRRAAGPVRDLDVQRKLLEQWTEGEQGHPLREQALALDAWLKEQRSCQARKMLDAISKPQQRLAELGPLPTFELGKSAGGADAVAMDFFARAAYAMPQLDAENLHDFRKAAKKARYIAEAGSGGPGSREPGSVGKACKRVQDAIGEWHDWLCLQQDACEALGDDAPELRAALDAEVERHFLSAINITQSMRGKLLGEWQAVKRPPIRATTARNRRSA